MTNQARGPGDNPGNGPDNGNGNDSNGPPDHANASERARERAGRRTERESDGTIEVSDDRLAELERQIDWDNLSPVEEYLLIMLFEVAE